MEADVDGSRSLAEQQNSINYAQQVNNARLTAYAKGPVPANIATLEQVPMGEDVAAVTLVEAPTAAAIAALPAAGKQLIFHNPVHVEGVEKDVAGFR